MMEKGVRHLFHKVPSAGDVNEKGVRHLFYKVPSAGDVRQAPALRKAPSAKKVPDPFFDLSIAIVNWNTRVLLADCLASIADATPSGLRVHVCVVDNASTDASADMVRERFGGVDLVANRSNVGFAAANNQAIARATGRVVLLLNPDTIVHAGALEQMVAYLDAHDHVGAVAPHLLNADGTTQRSVRDFPTFAAALYQYTLLRACRPLRRAHRRYKMRDFDYDRTQPAPQPMAAALAIRRHVLDRIGPMDAGFFMYYEDVDLCRRIVAGGWDIHYLADAAVTHLGGESSKQAKAALFLQEKKSLLRYFDKHRGRRAATLFRLFFKPLFAAKVLYDIPVDLAGACVNARRGKQEKAAAQCRNACIKAAFLVEKLPEFLII